MHNCGSLEPDFNLSMKLVSSLSCLQVVNVDVGGLDYSFTGDVQQSSAIKL